MEGEEKKLRGQVTSAKDKIRRREFDHISQARRRRGEDWREREREREDKINVAYFYKGNSYTISQEDSWFVVQ